MDLHASSRLGLYDQFQIGGLIQPENSRKRMHNIMH